MFELSIIPNLYLTTFEVLDSENFPIFRKTTNNLHVVEKTRLLEFLVDDLNSGVIPLSKIEPDMGWPKIQIICKEHNLYLTEVFDF